MSIKDFPLDIPVIDAHVHAYSEEAGRRLRAASGTAESLFGEGGPPGQLGTPEELMADLATVSTSKESGAILKLLTPTAEMAKAAWERVDRRLTHEEERKMHDSVKNLLSGRIKRRNAWGTQVSKQYPTLVSYVYVDPHFLSPEENVEEVELRVREGAKGITIHSTRNLHRPEDPRLWPTYEKCQELDLPCLAHSGSEGIKYSWMGLNSTPLDFKYVLDKFPRMRWIIGHMGVGYWDESIEIAKQYPRERVMFDTSVTIMPREKTKYSDEFVVDLIKRIGADRLMFGTDWIFGDVINNTKRVVELPISDNDKELILYKNAQEFLGK
jgi:predicted TIM-barrel fold metal-dependent hydrolase